MSAQPLPLVPHDTAAPSMPGARRLGQLAVASLHAELSCSPKPGLVTPFSRGSHDDMDAATFMRSLLALRGYFIAIAARGAQGSSFASLRQLGQAAEARMLRATGGVNTHRGAIFSLGLLVACAARLRVAQGLPASAEAVCMAVGGWHGDLLGAPLDPHSPGQRACRAHGIAGVREQAATGFPLLREVGVPALRDARRRGLDEEAARVHALMALIAVTDDLNLLHRGGMPGLHFAKTAAATFLAEGSVQQPDWRRRVVCIASSFEQRRLSPGGSADLLACALFLVAQESVREDGRSQGSAGA